MSSNDSKPPFDSEIPEFLLEGSSKKDIWLYNNISILGKKTEYLLDKQEEQGKELGNQSIQLDNLDKKINGVDTKLKFTNGKIGSSLLQIKALEDKQQEEAALKEDLKGIVEAKKTAKSLLTSKIFYAGAAVFTIGAITIAKSQALQEWLLHIFG